VPLTSPLPVKGLGIWALYFLKSLQKGSRSHPPLRSNYINFEGKKETEAIIIFYSSRHGFFSEVRFYSGLAEFPSTHPFRF
jgi:hypothetical protein